MSARTTALLAIAAGIYLALRDSQAERPVKSLMPPTELAPERPALPQRVPTSDCPIFSELASERLAAELNDDAAVAAWLDGAK